MPGVGDVVWDVVDYSGPSQVEKEVLLGPFLGGSESVQVLIFISFFWFSGEELVLRGDQRHRDEEPEAGEVPRGAGPSSSSPSSSSSLLIKQQRR